MCTKAFKKSRFELQIMVLVYQPKQYTDTPCKVSMCIQHTKGYQSSF